MKVIDCIQGTPEWHAARAGRVTASKIADLMAKTKTGWGASRANYMASILAERLTGNVAETFSNDAMRWGTETEPEARNAYQFFADQEVAQVGFVLHPTIDLSGCSPDGLVGAAGMVEIKCPNTATHIDTLLGAEIPDKYIKQMQWQMRCCDRAWCDFVSYDPRLPTRMQLFVKRVDRSNELLGPMEHEVLIFLKEVGDKEAQLRAKFPEAIAA